MVITTYAKEQLAVRLGSNIGFPICMAIGSGSGLVSTSNVNLIGEVDRQLFTSTDFTTPRNMIVITDWSSLEMSGIQLKEFGAFSTSGANTGSCWNREGFSNITFDGTNELRIEVIYEVF